MSNYKAINYGWLNDYSGKTFAPITVSSAILVNLKNGTDVTTMPLDKFLSVQFAATKNYISTSIQEIEKKLNELRQHVYYNEEDSWSGGATQGWLSNPANTDADTSTKTDEEACAKTIQSQILDLRDRAYLVDDGKYYSWYDKNTGGAALSQTENAVTEQEYCGSVTLQRQIFSNQNRAYCNNQLLYKIVPANYFANFDDGWHMFNTETGKTEIPVFSAQSLTWDISVNLDKAALTVANENNETAVLTDGDAVVLTAKSPSEILGYVCGTIQTTAKNGKGATESSLELSKPFENNTNRPKFYGIIGSESHKWTDENAYTTYNLNRIKIDSHGLIEGIDENEGLTFTGASTVYGTTPHVLTSDDTGCYPICCFISNPTNKTATRTAYTSMSNEETAIYILGGSEPVLMGAAWNDYAEYRKQSMDIEPGYCATPARNGKLQKTTERMQYCDGIVSDTFGFTIGKSAEARTPLAVSGRVLAYCDEDINTYNIGDPVCAGAKGGVSKMTRDEVREYPDRIVGTVSEIPEYETWNSIKVNGRIWIKVK